MKKYLLFIISMLCTSIGAWADLGITYDDPNRAMGIQTNGDAALAALSETTVDQWNNNFWSQLADNRRTLNIEGDLSQEGINKIQSCFSSYYTGNALQLNLSNITLSGSITSLPTTNKINTVVLPNGTDLSSISVGDNIDYIYSGNSGNGIISIYVASGSTTVTELKPSVINSATTINIYGPGANDYATTNASSLSGKTVNIPFTGNLTVAGDGIETNITTALTPYSAAIGDIINLTVTGTLTSADVTWLNNNKSSFTSLTTLDLTGATFGTGVTKASIAAAVPSTTTVLYPASYTISNGCTVTIDMGKAMGDDLATILAQAKTALGSTNICTLIVTGEITNNDLIALGGTNMTGATRIDLSEATLASGATIDNIKLPTSLQQLVLPKDQTFSVGLKSKLTAATNLNYAYTPSSDCTATGPNQANESNPTTYKYNDTKNTIADYVWVNKADGLAEALENEEQLRNSFYIKVASGVALTATDINFGALTNKPTNYLFLDLSESIMTPTVADHYTVEDDIPYRIILPNNWSNADLAHFQNNTKKGNLAAVYSYEDTKLNILVIEDNSYSGTALQNPRIVRAGTNAIDILPGAYTYNHEFGTATTEGRGIITAINNASESIKSVYISIANTGNNAGTIYSIANSNITYLSFEGIKSAYNGGPTVNVTGCSKLQTLNLKDAVLSGVIANGITSLTTVDMTGTTNSGATNLSGTGLRTFTTNSSTNFGGALNLASTAITSFETQAKVTGDISLNACSSLTSLDISGTQFQNSNSKIHVHATDSESDNDVLSGLNNGTNKTILLPAPVNNVSFDKTRIHPNTDLVDNMEEVAASSSFEDNCTPKCRIEYNAETKVATVYAYTEGHFKALMEKDNNYSKFADGTIFKFDASCVLNAEDLASVAGNTANGNYNKYYVDLYDLPATYDDTKDGETTTKGAITKAIDIMRANNWQYKGLLLPKAAQNIGTTLIQDRTEDETKVATCSQSIAYSGAIGTSALTAAYIYKAAGDWGITHAERLGKMKEVMNLHPEIMSTTTNWSVSTNSPTPIDMSILPTSVIIGENTVNTSKLETVNNDMVAGTGIPSIYAYPSYENVMYTVATSTGIGNTPNLEILKVTGPVNATDIASVNQFTAGPRVLDLSATTGGITKAMLESITNANIEYIILPAGMTKDVVCEAKYKDALKNGKLKAVISSDGTDLVAYVNTPGSLAEARYLATGGAVDANTGLITPTQTGLKSVTLAGSLNASDIAANPTTHYLGANGSWSDKSGHKTNLALSGEQGTIATLDLEEAVFPTYSDMNFSWAGLGSISNVTLPTTMNRIPAECFNNITSIHELCIPYNYEYIENAAFYLAEVSHITTTDKNGALVDNGANTFTFSKNLKEIGQAPNPLLTDGKPTPLANPVFFSGAIHNLTDVYVLRTGYEDETFSPTKCYRGAFGAGPTYGWGGFDGGNIYCREKYKNGTQLFTILNFPDEASVGNNETKYNAMEKCYTDPTKVYTKKDQTGALDANGESIPWPTFSELGRSYNQAVRGLVWEDWTYSAAKQETGDIEGGVITATPGNPSDVSSKQNTEHYDFTDYVGWHEFVLSKATYVAPDETVVDEEIIRNFELDDWYTFCIPFDMTESEVLDLMGIPASHDNIINQFNGTNVEGTSYMPEIRTLKQVNRTQDSDSQGTVKLVLTKNLGNQYSENFVDWIPNTTSGTAGDGAYQPNVANTGDTRGEKIVLRGGHPYMIRPYKPVTDPATSIGNLGKYVLKRYSFPMAASCIYREGCYTELGGNLTKEKSKFASPYEGHIVLASYKKGESTTAATYEEDNKTINYLYKFIGQFWQQQLPSFTYYMTGHKWYYFKKVQSDANYDKYKWNQYVCIINVNSTQDADHSIKPNETGVDSKGHAVFNESLYIEYTSGHDDAFTSANGAPRFMIVMEGDENGIDGNTTAIDRIDGVDITPMNSRVYGMNGQYVGNSLEGLPQGIYIVNGKKVFVK